MIKINMDEELRLYNLENKWNDYIGVQKEVLRVLRNTDFFADAEIINRRTGMCIKINAKGIKETLGTGKRFQALPKKLKQFKIATLRHLKQIVGQAELIEDNVENIHEENGYVYAYFGCEVIIDGEMVGVRISVKKKVGANWFWIHNVDDNKKSSKLLDPSNKTELKET